MFHDRKIGTPSPAIDVATHDKRAAAAIAQVALDDPAFFVQTALAAGGDIRERALKLLANAVAAFDRDNDGAWPSPNQPAYFVPLGDFRWLPLNNEKLPLGYAAPQPFIDPQSHAKQHPAAVWEFADEPRSFDGVWSWDAAPSPGWLCLPFLSPSYGRRLGKVIAATADPLRYAVRLLAGDDREAPATPHG